ncbi:hypothetical protein KC350_g3142 [Hortaea werneckii]|nr:hypothetical protein KC350_g3142 [Hortaea werneckii]
MSWYITELALYHKEFIPVRPSLMARSALALARCILSRPQPRFSDWSARYEPQVVLNLSNYLSQPSQALRRKYASPQLSSVSNTIEMFLQRQAMLAQRGTQAPANDVPTMEIDSAPAANVYLTPSTPQKPGYPSVPTGVLTPPITPDKDYCGNTGYGMNQGLMPRVNACTPTPPPSAEQQQQMHFIAQAPQPQYVQYVQ